MRSAFLLSRINLVDKKSLYFICRWQRKHKDDEDFDRIEEEKREKKFQYNIFQIKDVTQIERRKWGGGI